MDSVSRKHITEQLQSCMCRLKEDTGDDAMKSSESFLRMGNLLSRLGEISGALRCFHDAFSLRNMKAEDHSRFSFHDFYTVQFALYLLGKKEREIVSVAEGDMIHDLIRETWDSLMDDLESSQFEFVCTDVSQWYASVIIDFPYELCDLIEINGGACHSDTQELSY